MAETDPHTSNLHHLYVEAINSNDIDSVTERLSDDIVFQAPGEPELVGKEAVREWGAGFFEAYEAHWDKTQQNFEQSGQLAISRYIYTARYVARGDGSTLTEEGKGVCIYRREENGSWLLIIDSWSTNAPT